MDSWYDKAQIWCPNCGQKWILTSTKAITQDQHDIWFKAAMELHDLIKEEREKEDGSLY